VPSDAYVAALGRELAVRDFGPVSSVDTIYLGGGTPSRLGPEALGRAIGMVCERFPPVEGAEVTIEANPDDVSPAAVAAWRAAGVNRVSLGVQSFDDRALAWMHRTHDAERATYAARTLADGGIDNWSLDLIFSLPASLGRDWERDVAMAVALDPPHVSLYGLTVEPLTPIARWRERGAFVEGGEDGYEREYLHADQALRGAGYDHYEVSNFGRPGKPSRHNGGYWNGASYVGLGPSAHGYDGSVRRWNEREYSAWARRVCAGLDPMAGSETLTAENRTSEEVYLGLRTRGGLVVRRGELATVTAWVDAGWAAVDGDILRLTPTGWLRLDALAASLTMLRSH
jgi:oxygen-independent coproporphyrinogen-3 oxidase